MRAGRQRRAGAALGLACGTVGLIGPVFGQTVSWIGAATGTYTVAGNWSSGVVPLGPTWDVFIDGGQAQNSTVVSGGGTAIRNLTISSGDRFLLDLLFSPGSFHSVSGGSGSATVNTAGTIEVRNDIGLGLGPGTITLTGGGTIHLNGGTVLVVGGTATTGFGAVTNVNTLIRGQGVFQGLLNSPSFVNQHIVRADVPGGSLLVYAMGGPSGFLNQGRMQALSGATLALARLGSLGAEFNNSGGTIQAVGGGVVHLRDNAGLFNGTFTSTGTGRMYVNQGGGSAPAIRSILNYGRIDIDDGATLEASGTITQNGSINLGSVLDGATLAAVGSLMLLDGTGTVNLTGPAARISGAAANVWLGCLVQGQGTIASTSGQLALLNTGTILSNVNGGSIVLDTGVVASIAGQVRATNGGVVEFRGTGGGGYTGSLGALLAENLSEIRLVDGANLFDFALSNTGNGRLRVAGLSSGTLDTFDNNASNVFVDPGATLTVQRVQTNTGTYTLLGALTGGATLSVAGTSANFAGGGTVVLDGPGAFISGLGGHRLTNTNNTFIGHGQFGNNALPITNNGTITARLGTLRLDPSATGTSHFVNGGTLSAISGGTLLFSGAGGGTFLSTAGTISVATGGVVQFDTAAVMQGGTVLLDGTMFQAGTTSFGRVSGQGSFVTQPGGVSGATHTRGPSVTVGAGGTLTIDAGGGTLGTSRIGAVPALAGRWDLTDHDLVVDYIFASPLTTMRALIASGYNGGSWNGTGLISSSAAGSSPVTALGYANATDLFTFFPQVFRGETIDGTTMLIAYTLAGDTNLDRSVDIGDFSTVAANFNTAAFWVKGDFNYSGTTDIADFSLLAANYNLSLPASLPRAEVVPEPLTVAVPMLAGGLLLRRLRPRRHRRPAEVA